MAYGRPSAEEKLYALRAERDRLARELAIRTELFATTSHELRTQLNGILGMAQVIASDGYDEAELPARVALIAGAGEAMRSLLDDILDVAKIETGRGAIDCAPFPLDRLVEDTARFWRPQVEAKGLAFRIESADCPGRVEGDAGRIRQILFNLLANAAKFTENGSITLRVLRDEASGMVAFSVDDTGIGVAEEQQPHIFERFRQADRSIARRFGGSGLGLAISQRLAQAMGGTLTLSSRAGEGSTFTLRLPLPGIADAEPLDRHADCLEDAHILIVGANVLNQRIVGNMLAPFVGSSESVDPARAAKRLADGGIDLVVADAVGKGDGLSELADAAAAVAAPLTLLLASHDDAHAIGDRSIETLVKPVRLPPLLAALRRHFTTDTISEGQAAPAA